MVLEEVVVRLKLGAAMPYIATAAMSRQVAIAITVVRPCKGVIRSCVEGDL